MAKCDVCGADIPLAFVCNFCRRSQCTYHRLPEAHSCSGFAQSSTPPYDSQPIDVFALGPDNAVWYNAWDGSTWIGWESLGGMFTSDPDCTSTIPDSIHVFARGQDNSILHIGVP